LVGSSPVVKRWRAASLSWHASVAAMPLFSRNTVFLYRNKCQLGEVLQALNGLTLIRPDGMGSENGRVQVARETEPATPILN
jgi:hypothetical protein